MALKEVVGGMEIVNDQEVKQGLKLMASQGVFIEPTSAIVVKAFEKFVSKGIAKKDGKNVMVLSGSGLKATDYIAKMI